MGVTIFTQEFTTSVAPSRMFKALVLDSHNLLPQLMPQSIKSIEYVHGDGGVGSIKQTNFHEGSQLKFLKHRTDALDINSYICKTTLIEGEVLGDKLESISYEVELQASGSGCVCKITSHYHTKGDLVISEEDIRAGKEKGMVMYKVVEEYLLANPDAGL